MYISDSDRAILWSKEVRNLKEEYFKKFGIQYPHFNYSDFKPTATKSAAEVYVDSLKNAVQ